MKKFAAFFILTFASLSLAFPLEAKTLPQSRKATKTVTTKSSGSAVGVSVRLRGDRQALILSLSNLSKAKSVSYILTYQTNGKDEGVSGSLDSSAGNSATREILFGTCSSGTCVRHGSISNMKLEVTVELPNGKQSVKRYRIRV